MTTNMCYLLWKLSIKGYKERITLAKDPVKLTEDSVLFTYFFDGNMKFFTFPKCSEGAAILYQRDIITRYTGAGNGLEMYRKKIHSSTGRDGTPLMLEYESEFTWEDLKSVYGYQLIDIVANWEYELTGKIAGFIPYKPKAPIRDMNLRATLTPMLPGQSKVVEFNPRKQAA